MTWLVLTRFASPLPPHWSQQLAHLSASERARLARLSRPQRREQFVVGHAVLRFMLSEAQPDATIGVASDGSPQILAATRTHVSIAHSGTAVAVALSDQPIGVDLESPHALRDPHAAGLLMNLAPDACEPASVLRAWVTREALFKADVPANGCTWSASWEGCLLALAGGRNPPYTCVFQPEAGLYNAVDLAWEMCVHRPVSTAGDIDVRNPVGANRGRA